MAQSPDQKWYRREYLRLHAANRRADAKAEGARRIDVTLRGKSLDDYETVRTYIEHLNRLMAERPIRDPRTGLKWNLPLRRLSDNEVIRMALDYAATAMREDDAGMTARLIAVLTRAVVARMVPVTEKVAGAENQVFGANSQVSEFVTAHVGVIAAAIARTRHLPPSSFVSVSLDRVDP